MTSFDELTLLKRINAPSDLKAFTREELDALADELRGYIISTVSRTGGHLSSNLGVVELTIALHIAFDFKKDRLVFDVGHQCYPHKLLTGRAEQFNTLRQKGGISGFPKTNESEYDSFNVGHSSTAVSAALGMLRAMRLKGDTGSRVVALVGDGALTGGLAYEALDDAGEQNLPLIVVLNDNEMSIDGNVGGVSSHLSKLRTGKNYKRFKRGLSGRLKKIPLIGKGLNSSLERLKNRIKYFVLPNVLFEEMGYTYAGPFDGHDIDALVTIFDHAKNYVTDKPMLIHVVTKKGKGYKPAEADPERFHGIGSFDEKTGESKSSLNNSKLFSDTLCELANEDSRIVAITAAMASGTGLSAFRDRFPDRFFDVAIAEQHGVTMAAGMAAAGLKPVFAVYSTFLQRGYDQLLHDVCLQRLPVVFGIDRAGLVGADGETHQGVYDIAYFSTLPNSPMLLSPSSQQELVEMLKFALKQDMPCAIRYGRGLLPSRQDEALSPDKIAEWQLVRPVKSITLVASGRLFENAQRAADGLDVGLVNARKLCPITESELELVSGAELVITIEDGSRDAGFGAQLARLAAQSGRMRVITLGTPNVQIDAASVLEQDELSGLTTEQIRQTIIKYKNNGV